MSYEGHVQYWCEEGHYHTGPEPYGDDYTEICPLCNSPIVFRNMVDDTNEPDVGAITPIPVREGSCSSTTEKSSDGIYTTTTVTVHGVFKIPQRSDRPRW